MEFYREFFGCLGRGRGEGGYSRVFKAAKSDSPLTKAFNKRASRPGKGGGDGEGRGIYSRDSSSCFDVNDEARILCGFLGNERMERMEGAAAAARYIDYAALYHRPGPRSAAPLSPLNGQSLRITGEKIE